MKKYSILLAEDVPHYGVCEIEAEDDARALEAAKELNVQGIALDPDYDNSICQRIVHIEDPDGNIIAHDLPLDGCFLRYGGEAERKLCDDAPKLLEALEAALDQLDVFVRFTEAGKDPDLEAAAGAVRALVIKHRRPA